MAELGSRVGVALQVIPKHEKDPKQVLLDAVGDMPPEIVMFNRILVAKYIRPSVKKIGSIMLPESRTDKEADGDIWQGKVGLVVAMGPQAYVDDETTKFHGQRVEVGDWVWFRAADGMACQVNKQMCWVLQEPNIIGKVPHPDYVW